jgi:hypothetical protein
MKQSNALLAAWLVLIAALVAALVYFTISSQTAAPALPDAPVVRVEPRPTPKSTDRKPPTPDSGRRRTRPPDSPPKAVEVTGIVNDRDGKPVAGAHVELFRQTSKPGQPDTPPDVDELRVVSQIVSVPTDSWELPRRLENWTQGADAQDEQPGPALATAESKDDGTFAIQLEARSGRGPFRLTAQKEELGTATVAGVDPGERVVVQLGQAAAFAGVVVTEVDSAPVAGARVKLEGGTRSYAGATGADGRFAIEDVSPGFYQLSVAAKGKTPLFETGFRIAAGDPNPYTLRLPRGTTLRVRCTIDADAAVAPAGGHRTGDPVANAQVVAFSEATYAYVIGRTGGDGVVEFQGLPAGRYVLNGLVAGLVSMGEEQVEIGRNELTKEASVLFEPAVETPIEVVDQDGRPVAGMDFYSLNTDEAYDALRSMKVGTTDGDGKIKFAFEWEGPRCAIYGFKQGYTFVRAYPDQYDSGEAIRLVAKKPIRVRGLVKTEDGHAVPDAAVEISVVEEDPDKFDDVRLEVRSDADGRYDFPFLPRVQGISLMATAPDGAATDIADLELDESKSDYTIDLLLETAESMAPKAPAQRAAPAPRVPPPPMNDGKGEKK